MKPKIMALTFGDHIANKTKIFGSMIIFIRILI
jgi:hypothetical protein